MIEKLADALVPIFVGLLAGLIAGRRGLMDSDHTRNLIALVMDFAIPCSLFLIILKTPATVLRQQLLPAVMIGISFCVVYLAVYLWARLRRGMSISDAAVLAVTIGYPNSAAVALPLFASAYGSASTVTAALSLVVGSITVSPVTVALLQANTEPHTGPVTLRTVLRGLPQAVTRPVIWVPLLAVLGVFLHLHLPLFAEKTLDTMGTAAAGSALLLTGLVVSSQAFRFDVPTLVMTTIKLVAQPLLAFAITSACHMSHEQVRDITMVSAVPAGFFGLVFGKEFHDTPEIASTSLVASYIGGIASMAGWMYLFEKLAR